MLDKTLKVFSNDIDFIKLCCSIDVREIVIISERSAIKQQVKDYFDRENVNHILTTSDEIAGLRLQADIGLMFGFGIKLSALILSNHFHGVLNFHPGSLTHYRGRHPIGWALIERQPSIILSIHKVELQFDLGDIFLEIKVPILNEDTEKNVLKRLKKNLTLEMVTLLISRLLENKPIKRIESGRYLPSLKNKFDVLLSEEHCSSFLIGLSRAKYDYGGFRLNGKHVGLVHRAEAVHLTSKVISFLCNNGETVYGKCE